MGNVSERAGLLNVVFKKENRILCKFLGAKVHIKHDLVCLDRNYFSIIVSILSKLKPVKIPIASAVPSRLPSIEAGCPNGFPLD